MKNENAFVTRRMRDVNQNSTQFIYCIWRIRLETGLAPAVTAGRTRPLAGRSDASSDLPYSLLIDILDRCRLFGIGDKISQASVNPNMEQ
ncbi:hypothetical protein GWI33_023207 [Rhynchophorus ferrugineus]|uniref:Uncharacterized protein n=1 Tax=Rhynchophorus ferrugineus TaxID=354439 RepID=A0A834HMW2_RHYFE|nr:hypothetical protein GWI33_023209 [Rhynchophorus ferrugineus]KAF7264445.1 hypothetical protein GWI33_023207 [Rhynchophorus ferrugineus]